MIENNPFAQSIPDGNYNVCMAIKTPSGAFQPVTWENPPCDIMYWVDRMVFDEPAMSETELVMEIRETLEKLDLGWVNVIISKDCGTDPRCALAIVTKVRDDGEEEYELRAHPVLLFATHDQIHRIIANFVMKERENQRTQRGEG